MSTTEHRDTLNGAWILDKTKEPWSMKHYLEIMNVDPMAIEAHEKGEKEHDTIHTITMDAQKVTIAKRSRVNNDLVVTLDFDQELIVHLPPGDRPKKSLATSRDPTHLEIRHTMQTINGFAQVTDIKHLQQEEGSQRTYLVQSLTIHNQQTGRSATTTRYFLPYTPPPPTADDAATTAAAKK